MKNVQQQKVGLDEYEKALWNWVNVDDLDGFLQEVGFCGRTASKV